MVSYETAMPSFAGGATRSAARANAVLNRCVVCLDIFSAPVLTPCGHRFCEACILTAINIKKECPTCRAPIKSHRALRADTHLLELFGTPKASRAMDTDDERAAATDDSWSCLTCTLVNPVGVR